LGGERGEEIEGIEEVEYWKLKMEGREV